PAHPRHALPSVPMASPPPSVSPHRRELKLRQEFVDRVRFARSKNPSTATPWDRFVALSLAVRDQIALRWIETQRTYYERDVKRAHYLSAEYLLGRALRSNLYALGMQDEYRKVLGEIGIDLDELFEQESDAGLGNGGLGRLAACFLESLATLSLPGMGYGIRYEFGIFEQAIRNGYQVERADEWLKFGNPWEFARPEYTVPVGFGGHTMHVPNESGGFKIIWKPSTKVIGVPYDTPIAGYMSNTVNTLRLWAARADQEFDFSLFNAGDYLRAVEEKNHSEVISKVLYPNDSFEIGRELRLKQEYFFVACSIHDIVWRYKKSHRDFSKFSDKVAIQLNDTHPAVAIAELMRVLVDENQMEWEDAWKQTVAAFGYTNHTLLPEALERWPATLFQRLLPRHFELIGEINRRFMREVMSLFPHSPQHMARMSIISEGPEREVRMAHLAVVGSHSVNGVAKLHSELIQTQLLKDFHALYPERFNNKTNGVTPRRWLLECNPGLASLITERIGEGWATELERLKGLEPFADDPEFRTRLRTIKMENKLSLAGLIYDLVKLRVDPQSMYDVQIKRLHEYKRQHLAALHAVTLYLRAKRGENVQPRTILFGAKAAPGYRRAKLIIKLIHAIADIVNADKRQTAVRVAFLPNYRVSLAERIIPAADLSEQISTAGMEASGTGNMKLAMNGALTIGTLDGANIEIRDAVGEENFFLFGLTADEVLARRAERYDGRRALEGQPLLAEAVELIRGGFFCPEEPQIFAPLIEDLLGFDPYLVLADFASYAAVQAKVDVAFGHADDWTRMAALNIARVGQFSSDRTINEYARDIWGVEPCRITSLRDPSLVPDSGPDPV
ncbi:MAG: glycogen/starch/alpha-glucan phosphorylase, partial [Polyangiaceae bacterium]|nr:glycogen/starch/alpha-glucan phosphorylase [Polyangiaceae bacterium]